MRESYGLGTIHLVFKDLPKVAQYYVSQLNSMGESSFLSGGGPITRITTQRELDELVLKNRHQFDIFTEHPASEDHYEAVVLNNNAGGPTYVIPKDFVTATMKATLESNL